MSYWIFINIQIANFPVFLQPCILLKPEFLGLMASPAHGGKFAPLTFLGILGGRNGEYALAYVAQKLLYRLPALSLKIFPIDVLDCFFRYTLLPLFILYILRYINKGGILQTCLTLLNTPLLDFLR